MANEVVCSVMEAPSSRVTGVRLASIRSPSTWSGEAAGPMPRMPFSLCRMISRPAGRHWLTCVGMPMPRLTMAPSGRSWATSCAICLRFRGGNSGCMAVSDLDDGLHEDALGHDMLWRKTAQRHDFPDLHDGVARGHAHDGVEVARGKAVLQVAPAIAHVSLDEGEVGGKRLFQDIAHAIDDTGFLALGHQRAVARWREEGPQACSGSAQPLCQRALRHTLQFHLPGTIRRHENVRMLRTGMRADHLAHAPGLDEGCDAHFTRTRIVADHGQVARPHVEQGMDQLEGDAGIAEPADHDGSAVRNDGQRFLHRRLNL